MIERIEDATSSSSTRTGSRESQAAETDRPTSEDKEQPSTVAASGTLRLNADAVAARREVMQRSEAQRQAAAKLADPQDLWRDLAQRSDVVNEAGHIDSTNSTA